MKRGMILIFCFLILWGVKETCQADDLDIYHKGAAVKPNVMIIFDNSTSMDELVPYLDRFTYGKYPKKPYYDPDKIYYRDCCLVKGCYPSSGGGGNPCQDERCSLETPWETRLANVWNQILTPTEAQAEWSWDDLCENVPHPDPCQAGYAVYCREYQYSEYNPPAGQSQWIDVVPYKNPDGLGDNNNANNSSILYLVRGNRLNWAIDARKRYDVAAEAVRDVIDEFNNNVNFGLMVFRYDNGNVDGAKLLEPMDSSMDRNTKKRYLKDWLETRDCKPGGRDAYRAGAIMYTPLAEALTHAGMYYRGGVTRQGADRYYGYPEEFYGCFQARDGGQQGRPKHCDPQQSGWQFKAIRSAPIPVTESCQKNYVILMTDGNPSFDTDKNILATFLQGYDKENALPEIGMDFRDDRWPGNTHSSHTAFPADNLRERQPNDLEQQHFLDNVARALYEKDLIADEITLPPTEAGGTGRKATGVQNVVTYVIGFGIGNELLKSTGYWGTGGEGAKGGFIEAGDLDSLQSAFTTVIKDILKAEVVFAPPSIPGAGMVSGDYMYIPYANTLFKEGGDVIKKQISTGEKVWSASDQFKGMDVKNRGIYTLIGAWAEGSPIKLPANEFRENNVSPELLGLDSSETSRRNDIVDYVRGLEIDKTDRTQRAARKKGILGGVLHSSPAVVNYYKTGTTEIQNRMVFFGANDGMLHAVDESTGKEMWAFIPPDLLPKLQSMVSFPEGRNYYVDSSPKAVALDSSGQLTRDPKKIARRILAFGERKGGNHYWALDITSRDNPKVLWKINGDMPGFEELGQTWSEPSFGKIKNSSGQDVTVAFFGGGYPTEQRQGRAIYAVHVLKGEKVWSRTQGNEGVEGRWTLMTHAIPSEVLVTDTDDDGYVDFIYVGDLGGHLQVHNLSDKFAANSPKSRRLFNAPGGKKIFYPPDVVKELDGNYIYFGTGDRDQPLQKSSDRFYCVKDKFEMVEKGEGDKITEVMVFKKTDLRENNLVDLTSNPYQSGGDKTELNQKDGWYISLAAGEKVMSSPTVALGIVLFTTFTPVYDQHTSDDPCSIKTGGNSQLYAVSYLDATAVFPAFAGDSNTLGADDRSFSLAGGIPTGALLSFSEGPTVPGQPTPPLQMRVDVFMEHNQKEPAPPVSIGGEGQARNISGFKAFTWRVVNP